MLLLMLNLHKGITMTTFKVLIVDDSIDNLKLMVSVFEKYEPTCEVFQTNTPTNAVTIATKVLPDLIITDWNMPEFSGIELIKYLKKEAKIKDTPIIMATGVMLTPEDLKTALNAGAIDYIRKPIEPVELIARSKSALLITSYYKALVDQKDKELTESSLHLLKGQEFNRSFAGKIDNLKQDILSNSNTVIDTLDGIKDELLREVNEDGWYRFNLSFSQVHADFNKNITDKHPNLTPSELKLCAFIRLGMANKEIAGVLNQTGDSVKTSRYRLRKKMNLEGVNLESYISGF